VEAPLGGGQRRQVDDGNQTVEGFGDALRTSRPEQCALVANAGAFKPRPDYSPGMTHDVNRDASLGNHTRGHVSQAEFLAVSDAAGFRIPNRLDEFACRIRHLQLDVIGRIRRDKVGKVSADKPAPHKCVTAGLERVERDESTARREALGLSGGRSEWHRVAP